jgi:hypothetical protein
MSSHVWHERRTKVAAAIMVGALFGASTQAARAHIQDSTAGITHDLYTPGLESRCVYGPGNCATHTYQFVSANDVANTNFVCAQLYNPSNHSPPAGSSCNQDFVRHCQTASHVSPFDAAHCIDYDSVNYHAGARNGDGLGTTIRRHAVY